MKRFTIIAEFGWCGFGASHGLVPELRLGLLRLACCRGSIIAKVMEWGDALAAAAGMARGASSAESGR